MADSQIAHGPTLPAGAPAANDDRLPAGASAGDYVVEKFLGAGAMGEVYAGRHPVIGKRVAIKILKRELAADPEAAERFVREAKAVNQIDHPNVIDVFNFGRLADGRLFLVMDLVDGRSLRKAVQDGPLAIDATLEVLAQIADALDAAHARGVVHRDLKPDNVMLGDSTPPKVFVLDFGIAKLVTEGQTGGTLTAKGSWLGTPGYMAPEQWSSDGAGPASDRYALGVMAYELLSGTLPFQAPTLPQMMEQHFRAPVPALSTRGTVRHHATLDPVLARAMAKDPTARFATARELVEALRTAAGGKAVAGAAAKRSLGLPAVAGVGVLGLAIVGFVMVRRGPGGDEPSERAGVAADGFVRIQVITQPRDATVTRDGQRLGTTPVTAEVRAGTAVQLAITKPGYRPVNEKLAPGKDVVVRKDLEPIVGFEGVWAMPDGQLRGFKRIGERIAVTKHATVTGEGEVWRTFELVEPPEGALGVVFATSVELTDDRGLRDPDCQISHKVEYHFDPARDTLDVRAERVETARQHGRCIVRTRLPGTPTALVRADRDASDTRWTQPPVGVPSAQNKLPPADVPQKQAVSDEDLKQEKRRVEQANKRAAKRDAKQNFKRPPQPQNDPGDMANRAAQRTEQQAPRQVPDPDPPASKNAQQAPQQAVPPRGDAQVAPQ